jgi:hypothetical protein
MLKLLLQMLGEILIAVSLSGLVLAVGLPALMKAGIIVNGDTASSLVVAATLVLALAGVLLRPGSALNRRRK